MTTSPTWKFDTLLVANRGEIACRIIRTAKALGLKTVAVYSDADVSASHTCLADVAVRIGDADPQNSYLNQDAVLAAAKATAAGAIHPGYGFLSENATFARRVEQEGLVFVGPTPQQLEDFGLKHTARRLAGEQQVPMLSGTELLADVDAALAAADQVGYPVMVKASAGGGGIGMEVCEGPGQVRDTFERVTRLAANNFASAGVFLERLVRPARHVEVQIFGDGTGNIAVLGDRDCSLQRRNQKVVEEAPAPNLSDQLRAQLHDAARRLGSAVGYRSAGTIEFIFDPTRGELAFLEVNTRLQVEHPVTEQVMNIDLVEQMLRLAGLGPDGVTDLMSHDLMPQGHAFEARVYAEDPNHASRPSSGTLTCCDLPATGQPSVPTIGTVEIPGRWGLRADSGVALGSEISHRYDPMLAKLIAHAQSREEALDLLNNGLEQCRLDGVTTNLGMLRAVCQDSDFRDATHHTHTLDDAIDPDPRIEVLQAGLVTTVQDWPGRVGYWDIGVPPSGAMDDLSLRTGNLALGNPGGAPGLECTLTGPTLRFSHDTWICLTGAPTTAALDGQSIPMWEPVLASAGSTLAMGNATTAGQRTYLTVQGGIDVPTYLGSASTFTMGRFGGHAGRALQTGDVLHPGAVADDATVRPVPAKQRPAIVNAWQIAVTEGPHAAPEFFTRADIDELYATDYEVHFNSDRTGIRLIGPKPRWTREDGGEAGLHPSNIHDNAYAIGALDFTGDTPIILGPDGPSLGGFVCPAVVASGDRWKLGQLRAGDTIRFVPVDDTAATTTRATAATPAVLAASSVQDDGILARVEANGDRPEVTIRRAGDDNVLVEYGQQVLDISLRMRVQALLEALQAHPHPGIVDLTPGIRSLQVHTDPTRLRASSLVGMLLELDRSLPDTSALTLSSRTVELPLSWDDPATRLATERYMNTVRSDAPWTPWNIEFIRRVNGLDSVEEVHKIVFDATYLVLGLGDVYLGAPVATPLDPRHRLVTTKYNPARTWTAENSVGIGGAYLCIYGMEGPGGYQFVGRTTQVWNRWQRGDMFAEHPWSLRFFDQIRWYPVSAKELLDMRADVEAGRASHARFSEGTFHYGEYARFLEQNKDSIEQFRSHQSAAFGAEREVWRANGEFDIAPEPTVVAEDAAVVLEPGQVAVEAPMASSVFSLYAEPGARVEEGDPVASVEAMKMETRVAAPVSGAVVSVHVEPGAGVHAGQVLAVIEADQEVSA